MLPSQGSIPTQLGLLSHLVYLKLSYNSFVGVIPLELGNLETLELLHLQGNRMEGEIVLPDLEQLYEESSFITDCGSPAYYEMPIVCKGCTICCNKDGNCHHNEKPRLLQVQAPGFQSYETFCWMLLVITFVLCLLLASASFIVNLTKENLRQSQIELHQHTAHSSTRRFSISRYLSDRYLLRKANADDKYALTQLGEGSVYSFFCTNHVLAWSIACSTTAIQAWMVSITACVSTSLVFLPLSCLLSLWCSSSFHSSWPQVRMSHFYSCVACSLISKNPHRCFLCQEFDLSREVDLEYTWKCIPSGDVCTNTNDVTVNGWVTFVVLMAIFLLKDLVCGLKLIILAGKKRHPFSVRARFFCSGVICCCITVVRLFRIQS